MSDANSFTQTLSNCRRILLTTHVRPDGDALGTTAAIHLGLKQKNIDSQIVLLSKLPGKYAFIFDENAISHAEGTDGLPAGLNVDAFDALLVADTGTWSQLPGMRPMFENWPKPKLVLDHHLTAEVAVELFDAWNITIDRAIATALYVALVSDTGWFQFSNTKPFTLRLAARLMEAGVDTDRLNILLNQNERKQRVFLQTRAMQSLELLADDRVAAMTVSREDFSATGAGVPATENLVNVPLQIGTVEVAMLIVEPPEGGPIRVSLRSKGKLDCAAFAQRFGGGGHARAAGAKLDMPLSAARDKIETAIVTALG
jgi:bifunctional oligoribonuclease and PAP phosphatase NrnA